MYNRFFIQVLIMLIFYRPCVSKFNTVCFKELMKQKWKIVHRNFILKMLKLFPGLITSLAPTNIKQNIKSGIFKTSCWGFFFLLKTWWLSCIRANNWILTREAFQTALLTGYTVFIIRVGYFTYTRTSIIPGVSTFKLVSLTWKRKCMIQMYK